MQRHRKNIGGKKTMTNPFKGTGGSGPFKGQEQKMHKTIWQVTGVGHTVTGGSTHLRSVMELGWAAQKVHAAEAFAKLHAHKYKKLDIHDIIKLK
jgi:hypothetical protein